MQHKLSGKNTIFFLFLGEEYIISVMMAHSAGNHSFMINSKSASNFPVGKFLQNRKS
jgi:hypothetical protein